MKTLFSSLIFAQLLSASVPAQALEEQARKPAPATGASRPKAQPPTIRTTQDPRTDAYGALVENASRSADQFRNENTSGSQDRDRLEDAGNSQPEAASDKKSPQRKPNKPSF